MQADVLLQTAAANKAGAAHGAVLLCVLGARGAGEGHAFERDLLAAPRLG